MCSDVFISQMSINVWISSLCSARPQTTGWGHLNTICSQALFSKHERQLHSWRKEFQNVWIKKNKKLCTAVMVLFIPWFKEPENKCTWTRLFSSGGWSCHVLACSISFPSHLLQGWSYTETLSLSNPQLCLHCCCCWPQQSLQTQLALNLDFAWGVHQSTYPVVCMQCMKCISDSHMVTVWHSKWTLYP